MSQKHTSWVVKKNEINAVVTRWGAITPQVDVIRLISKWRNSVQNKHVSRPS